MSSPPHWVCASKQPLREGRLSRITALLLTLAIAAIAAGCGGSSDADPTTEPAATGPLKHTDTVTIEDFTYKPDRIAVPEETLIKVINRDSTRHTLTSLEPGGFDSGSVHSGKKAEATLFVESGTYPFYCIFHPTMRGELVVEK